MVQTLSAQRLQVDVSSKFTAAFLILVPVTAALLWRHQWWLLLTAVCLVLARVSYKGAIAAAIDYGETIRAAFDLHRFDLLEALRLEMPRDSATERALFDRLTSFLYFDSDADFTYSSKPRNAEHD